MLHSTCGVTALISQGLGNDPVHLAALFRIRYLLDHVAEQRRNNRVVVECPRQADQLMHRLTAIKIQTINLSFGSQPQQVDA